MRLGGKKNQLYEVLNRGNQDDDHLGEDKQGIFVRCQFNVNQPNDLMLEIK